MGYANFDHAAWIEQQIEVIKKYRPKQGKLMPEKLSEFQKRVFNIIGIVGNGIYNAPFALERVVWDYGGGMSLSWRRELSSWDFNTLTTLLFLCHEARIRVQIESTGPNATKLSFWQRKSEGGISSVHPNLDEAVASFREWFKPTHQINYREEEKTEGVKEINETCQHNE